MPEPAVQVSSEKQPIVLELFTSQGCSSCPPADQLLSAIGEADDVIALALHVDYWNYIGWRDPFSSAAHTKRQQRYGTSIARQRVYTPMLVIDGASHVVGSDRTEVAAALERARAKRPSGVSISIRDAAIANGRVRAKISVVGATGELDLYAAVRESGLETKVSRGENSGATLRNDFIVRELIRLDGEPASQSIDAPIASDSGASRRTLVVFGQKRDSLEVVAAARADL